MAAGWTANSLIGLAGLRAGGAFQGSLNGGVAMNTTSNLVAPGTGVPPFVQGALNPFLSAVSGMQNSFRNAAMGQSQGQPRTINIVNEADKIRAQTQQRAQADAENQFGFLNRNLGGVEDRLRQIAPGPTPIGDIYGPERAALQQRILGLRGQIGQVSPFAFGGMSPMGGWSSTFAIPTY
jgi:hypothetical protein